MPSSTPTGSAQAFPSKGLRTVLDYFYDWESSTPDATFLRQPKGESWLEWSWAEVGRQARQMVAAIRDLGLEKGDHVGLLSKNCTHWIITDLALMMGGFVSVPFYPTLTARQLAEVLEMSDVKALFVGKLETWDEQREGVPEDMPIIRFPHYPGNSKIEEGLAWDACLERYPPIEGNPRVGLHDLWTILFTSGTTGSPKGVMLPYYATSAMLKNEELHATLGVFEGDEHHYFSYLPLNHIAERVIVEVAAIMTGGDISFAESIDTFAKNLQDTQPTLFMAVPRIWTKFQLAILERMPQKRLSLLLGLPVIGSIVRKKIRKGLGLSRARIMLTGAAPTPQALKDWYLELGIGIQEVYAQTENCGGCTLMPAHAPKPDTVGTPLPNVALNIDEDSGEVLMRAPWVMTGYYKQPGKTAEVLAGGWLHTGDQGELDEDGYLRLTGRVSDTFKSAKGKFIVPAPLEWGFAKNNFIEQICVLGLAQPQPLALVVLSEIGQRASKEEVCRALARSLEEVNADQPKYARLQRLVIVREDWSVDNGLLTPTMKIKRNEMNRKYAEKLAIWSEAADKVIWENG